MTHYLGITATRKIAPTPGAEKIRGELAVKAQIEALGGTCEAPEEITFERRGKSKERKPTRKIILPGYVFFCIEDERYHLLRTVEGLGAGFMRISWFEMAHQIIPFLARAAEARAEAERIIAKGDRAAMCSFAPGDAVELLSGPFMDRAATFVRMVQQGDGWPMAELDMGIFGKVRVDAGDVRGK